MRGGRRLACAFACLLAGAACDPKAPPQVRGPSPSSESLYGDPALVPTPDGEHARRELALAGDLKQVLALEDAHVVVRLPRGQERVPEGPVTVLVEGRALDGDEQDADEGLREEILDLARAIVHPQAQVDIILRTARPSPARRPMTDPLLWLALLGLGLSLGVAFDRRRRQA